MHVLEVIAYCQDRCFDLPPIADIARRVKEKVECNLELSHPFVGEPHTEYRVNNGEALFVDKSGKPIAMREKKKRIQNAIKATAMPATNNGTDDADKEPEITVVKGLRMLKSKTVQANRLKENTKKKDATAISDGKSFEVRYKQNKVIQTSDIVDIISSTVVDDATASTKTFVNDHINDPPTDCDLPIEEVGFKTPMKTQGRSKPSTCFL